MSHSVRRSDGLGTYRIDLTSCHQFTLKFHDGRMPRQLLYHPESGRWIREDDSAEPFTPRFVEISPSQAAQIFREHGLPLPAELAGELRTRPRWERVGPPYELWYGETLCLKYQKWPGTQGEILNAFDDAGWPETLKLPVKSNGRPILDIVQLKNALGQIHRQLQERNAPIWIGGESCLRWQLR